ncbi:quinoprotein dehydrogenase-associated putative ABC transporter substrate-binding protein [Salinisphaera sp. P385]|uniref:Quinoprotein dehydrogenase-associated putative ABC transporter substrate-binding protein n=1 Tax=Spectribacter acetivorans TaxID=3075603 RepID=A0ABU3BAI3_9GAMM|nr:quinoprotein dehydrogenase-associated putative ABC transporter substrate-binding protein [Salinisphaera sp. P385]MDT0619125.1 quinoprotein dehydrogenase-associated putative ABC transporter substrate-binding protein [Salinisphaera sp. P385]
MKTRYPAWIGGIVAALLGTAAVGADEREAFRACADPSNMPMVNEAGEGFENKIAELFADKLGLPLEYYWVPQQMGFGRVSLKNFLDDKNRYACDVVLSAGSGFEVGQTTPAYFRSTYVMVFPEGTGLDDVQEPADLLDLPADKRENLRIGGFTKSPPVTWLQRNGMLTNLVGYRTQSGSRDFDPGDVIRNELVNGDLDIVMLWGPIGGYYAQQIDTPKLRVVPFEPDEGLAVSFPIRMAVRYGENEWMETVSNLIRDNRDEIESILADYNVPLVPLTESDKSVPDDDD